MVESQELQALFCLGTVGPENLLPLAKGVSLIPHRASNPESTADMKTLCQLRFVLGTCTIPMTNRGGGSVTAPRTRFKGQM